MLTNKNKELEQSYSRLGIVAAFLIYTVILEIIGIPMQKLPLFIGYACSIASICIVGWIIKSPTKPSWRKTVVLFLDIVGLYSVFFFSGMSMLVFMFTPFLIIISYGIRYGEKWLLFSSFVSTSIQLSMYMSGHVPNESFAVFFGTIVATLLITLSVYSILININKVQFQLEIQKIQLQKQVNYDSLTKIGNRNLLNEKIKQAFSKCNRTQQTIALIYFDLDGFKKINDTYGHKEGDNVLKKVANKVSRILHPTDTFVRLGGDEFAIILQRDNIQLLTKDISEKILRIIRNIPDEYMELPLSSSIGYAFYDGKTSMSPTQLISKADSAMYEAKSKGKNMIIVAS